jgi:hypothetical protein
MASEKTLSWWVFFPLCGLEITDEAHDLDSAMFGDATILSKRHIEEVVRRAPLDAITEKQIVHVMEAWPYVPFHSLVAIRRSEKRSSEPKRPGVDLSVIDAAADRAHQLGALLCLGVLARSKVGRTCGLVEEMPSQKGVVTMISTDGSRIAFGPRGYTHLAYRCHPENPIEFSRKGLIRHLGSAATRALYEVLAPQNPNLAESCRRAITQAAIRLSDAVHALAPAAQLLGAVTAMEVLLSRDDAFQTIERRIIGLIGEAASEGFAADIVLKARHAYVHRAEIPDEALSANAIALGLSCLLRFAEIAPKLRDHRALMHYLDFLQKADSLETFLSTSQRRKLVSLVHHRRRGHTFDFLSQRSRPLDN